MRHGWVLLLLAALLGPALADTEPVTLRAAVVAVTDDAELRKSFEESLAAKARTRGYDAVASSAVVSKSKKAGIDTPRLLRALRDSGIKVVLVVRPTAVGAGSSLESVRNEISPEVFRSMKTFAETVGNTGPDDLIAVVHLAIYTLEGREPELLSSGAVWLDENVSDRAEGIARLQDLIADNVDAARPALRRRLGLPPLPRG